tara:strand:- start:387 stop:692 length:306 start_codon:yes stop_codon:yes gene_type:complete
MDFPELLIDEDIMRNLSGDEFKYWQGAGNGRQIGARYGYNKAKREGRRNMVMAGMAGLLSGYLLNSANKRIARQNSRKKRSRKSRQRQRKSRQRQRNYRRR